MEEKKTWWAEKDMMLILDLSEKPEVFETLDEWKDYIKKEEVVIIDSHGEHCNTKLVKMQPNTQKFLDSYSDAFKKYIGGF